LAHGRFLGPLRLQDTGYFENFHQLIKRLAQGNNVNAAREALVKYNEYIHAPDSLLAPAALNIAPSRTPHQRADFELVGLGKSDALQSFDRRVIEASYSPEWNNIPITRIASTKQNASGVRFGALTANAGDAFMLRVKETIQYFRPKRFFSVKVWIDDYEMTDYFANGELFTRDVVQDIPGCVRLRSHKTTVIPFSFGAHEILQRVHLICSPSTNHVYHNEWILRPIESKSSHRTNHQ